MLSVPKSKPKYPEALIIFVLQSFDMKKVIYTKNAPEPIGPYSQAVMNGDMLYMSGQIAIDPKTNELVSGEIEVETKQVMENIKSTLSAAEMEMSNIIKTSIFILDMGLFSRINEVYGEYFDSDFPARETVAVKTLPKNVNIEISVIAAR
ncbi:MAG: 2-iminobutanoate/2-iminopropanoate deaminase [Patiriisocius sp.]